MQRNGPRGGACLSAITGFLLSVLQDRREECCPLLSRNPPTGGPWYRETGMQRCMTSSLVLAAPGAGGSVVYPYPSSDWVNLPVAHQKSYLCSSCRRAFLAASA